MKRFDRFSVATTLALIVASSMAIAQSGSVLSDMSNPEVVAKGRAEAAAAIKCDTPSGWDAQMAAFRANAKSKWDHVAMDCAVKAGAAAIRDVSIPVNVIWAFVTFRVDNIEAALEVLGAHLEYFDVLDKAYSDFYQGIEKSSELHVRWEQTRASGAEILTRVEPLADAVPEVRVLRAAYILSSTARETETKAQNVAVEAAIADLSHVIKNNPETLDGLAHLILGQILLTLPEFLGGDALAGIALLETSQEMNPNDISIHMALAEAYIGEREDDKAVAMLEAALAVDPATNNTQDYFDEARHMGGLAQRLGKDDLAVAFDDRRKAQLAVQPYLLTRKEHGGSFGHGEDDPITGKSADTLTSD